VGALIEALLSALEAPPAPDARIGIDRWAAEAAMLYVLHVAGYRDENRRPLEIPRPKRGRGGQWASGFRGELNDLLIYHQVTEACEGGMPIGKAITHVAARRAAEGAARTEDAVRKAHDRARDRRTENPLRYEFWERWFWGPWRKSKSTI
jgi:hypothetical protein